MVFVYWVREEEVCRLVKWDKKISINFAPLHSLCLMPQLPGFIGGRTWKTMDGFKFTFGSASVHNIIQKIYIIYFICFNFPCPCHIQNMSWNQVGTVICQLICFGKVYTKTKACNIQKQPPVFPTHFPASFSPVMKLCLNNLSLHIYC